MKPVYTVMAILEAKADKVDELELVLRNVAELSRLEDTNVEYRLHKSLDNPRQFMLYENWVDKPGHALQFEKSYIKEVFEKLDDLLAAPFIAFNGEEL